MALPMRVVATCALGHHRMLTAIKGDLFSSELHFCGKVIEGGGRCEARVVSTTIVVPPKRGS